MSVFKSCNCNEPLGCIEGFCVYPKCGTFEPCRSTAGDQPLLPHSHCSQLCQGVPEIPAPRRELELHCRGDVVLSCRICTTGAETELQQGTPWTHNPISHPTAWHHSPSWERGGHSFLHTLGFLFCSITSSEQNKQICNLIAKVLLPSGLARSLQVRLVCLSVKTPTINPKVFKTSKTPLLPLCLPQRAPIKPF